MAGRLDETYFGAIKERHDSSQRRLSSFSQNDTATTIAVVRKPRTTGIDEICDEWWPELGMPERHLTRFQQYRAGFRTNSAVDNPIERAYDEANLDYHYDRYIRSSEQPQNALSRLTKRLESGEDLTLVCFEKPSQPCHRHRIIELVEARLSSDFDLGKDTVTV